MKRILCLLLSACLLAASSSVLAEEEAAPVYVDTSGASLHEGTPAYSEAGVSYMPAAAVMEGLGQTVTVSDGSVTIKGITLTANSRRIAADGRVRIATLPPVEKNGVLYAPELLMTELFGLRVTKGKDGTIKLQMPAEGTEMAVTDDSWYDAYIAEKQKQPTPPAEKLTPSQQLRKNYQKSLYSDQDISDILSRMNEEGRFTDLDYNDTNLSNWQPGTHVSRLGSIAKSIYNPKNKQYMDPEGLRKLELGIKYWFDNNFVSQNWWWNSRGVPDHFMVVAAFDPEIPEKYKKKLDEITKEQPGGSFRFVDEPSTTTVRPWEGAEAGVPFQTSINEMIALRLSDEEVTQRLTDIFKAVNIEFTDPVYPYNFNTSGFTHDTDEHMRGDYSYTCHGYQLLINTYGTGLIQRSVQLMLDYAEGMGYKLSDEAAEEIARYIVDGWRYFGYRNYMNNTTLGRGAGQVGYDYQYLRYQKEMYKSVAWRLLYEYPNVSRKAELLSVINNMNNPKESEHFTANRYFWQTDFLSHNRSGYQFGVHPVSDRSSRPESVLNINCLGLYLGDGAYNLLKRGDEYNDLPPYMDWNQIPGVTAEQKQQNLSPGSRSSMGATSFVGGVSDGLYGASVFDYNFRGVSGKKAWFCFDDEIVCLGAGITGTGANEVYTTVNQTKLYGDVTASSGVQTQGSHTLTGNKWVLHDGIGYVFEGSETLQLENDTKTGNWKRIDRDSSSEDPVSGDVFLLSINHGIKPADASYCYTLLPETDEAGIRQYAAAPAVEIVSNTKDIQAVYHKNLKILQAGFYSAGSVRCANGLTLTADKPCVVMVTQKDGGYEVSAANPYNRATTLQVTLSGGISAGLKFNLPEGYRGNDAGRTMIYSSTDAGFRLVDNQMDVPEVTKPAELLAICVNDEVMEAFSSQVFTYTLNVGEIPEIKAKGNYPTTVETEGNRTVITVEDPDNRANRIQYFIQYNTKNE